MNVKSRINIFAERLKELRESYGMTKKDLAAKIDINTGNITRYENAVHGPNRDVLEKMALLFNINPAWLMGYDVSKYISDKPDCKQVPLVGDVAAGLPIDAQENVIGYEHVDRDSCVDFCLKIKGDSMINACIPDGSIVFVRKQNTFENGQIVIALIESEATCKRAYKENGALVLRSENPKYKPFVYTKRDSKYIKILGLVKYVKHEVY